MTDAERHDQGMAVRRRVLGDAHVDRARAGTSAFTADFQDLITRYAWGEIWTRPGLDLRTRSCITLTAMVAGGHLDELAMHVRAALRNGLTPAEIAEVLLQTAIYCGVPAANSAFKVAQGVLHEEGALDATDGGPAPDRAPVRDGRASGPQAERAPKGDGTDGDPAADRAPDQDGTDSGPVADRAPDGDGTG